MQQLVIVTGLSGAGKTVVLRSMEDMEFYCVDNLPIEMLSPFVSHIMSDKEFYPKISVGIDIRSSKDSLLKFPKILKELKEKNINIKVMYINASEQVLLNRFSETRRRHPLSTKIHKYSITEAIKLEAELVLPIKAAADLVLDTSNMTVHQLKQHLWKLMSEPSNNVSIILKSFAFKRGVPFDADFVFDARCLVNPYWQKELRSFNGKDEEIISFFNKNDDVKEYFKDLSYFSKKWISRFEANDRSYITIAIGCTGGQHRSVFLIEQLSKYLKKNNINAMVFHRELD